MLKKRLIGVVTVRKGWAVQSEGYCRYLPLGKPEVVVENLDRWGVDEILVQCIDRSNDKAGPDFALLSRLGALGLSTPLIYGGGIRHVEDAVQAVRLGADRLTIDTMLWDAPLKLESLSRELGSQALIAHMPVSVKDRRLAWYNYRDGRELLLNTKLLNSLYLNWVSEVMLTDWSHEGIPGGFDCRIPASFPLADKSLVVFGGLSEPSQIQGMLLQTNVVAVGVGNFLSYKEHAVQLIKGGIVGAPLRAAHYLNENYFL